MKLQIHAVTTINVILVIVKLALSLPLVVRI
jgi:hypothetical protein